MSTDLYLAGDIGGTKTVLAVFRKQEQDLIKVRSSAYASAKFMGLGPIIKDFLAQEGESIKAACFGVAGPVEKGRVKTTNLPWPEFSEIELSKATGIPACILLNDLEAMAWSVPFLPQTSLVELNPGRNEPGNAVLLAAGTGLGVALLFWDGQRLNPSATEGGHTEFAPADEEEMDLLRYLWQEYDHVSWERLVSGPGLANIYRFLRDTGRFEEEDWLARRMAGEDATSLIGRFGLEGGSPICARAVEMFIRLYGRAAGNLALRGMARGGVFIGGGIAPRLLPAMMSGAFLKAYGQKGRMSELVKSFPVKIILDQQAPLLGAARRACHD